MASRSAASLGSVVVPSTVAGPTIKNQSSQLDDELLSNISALLSCHSNSITARIDACLHKMETLQHSSSIIAHIDACFRTQELTLQQSWRQQLAATAQAAQLQQCTST